MQFVDVLTKGTGMSLRSPADITDLIIHHTAGPVTQTVQDIDAEHRAIGDAMIGYNHLITPDGKCYVGRPANYVPAAALGRNRQSLNVSLVGNFETRDPGYTGPPTDAALQTLRQYAIWAHLTFPSIVRTIGHRDVSRMFYNDDSYYATACPGDKLYGSIPALKQAVQAVLLKR